MGIFNDRSKRALVGAMRECVCDTLMESATLTSKQATDKMNFVFENATYEQLLNITINPNRDTNYLPSYVLEGAVAILHRACLTGREYIGKNAITEGAKLLAEETGAVVTESMKEAALNSVNNGNGLKVVRKLLEEAALLQEEMTVSGIASLANIVSKSGAPAENISSFNTLANAFANRTSGSFNALEVTRALNQLGIPAKNQAGIISALQAGDSTVFARLANVAKTTPAGGATAWNTALNKASKATSTYHREMANKFGAGTDMAIKASNKANATLDAFRNLGRDISAGGGIPGKTKINPAMYQEVNRTVANQSKRMNPWVAGGLGIAGALGGAYLYNRYKQNQAAQQ